MGCFENYFKKIDFVGQEFKFEHNENKRYQTVYGAFFSMIVFISALVVVILFGREIYERKLPIISMSEEISLYSKIYFNDFPFFFSFFYENNTEIKNPLRFFNIYIEEHHMTQDGYLSYNPYYSMLPYSKMKENYTLDSQDFIEQTLDKLPNYDFYSFNFTNETFIGSPMLTNNSNYMRFLFAFCDPQQREDCEYSEESFRYNLPTIVSTFKFSYAYSIDYEEAVKWYANSEPITVSPGSLKIHHMRFSLSKIITDKGWLLEDYEELDYVSYHSYFMDTSLSSAMDELFNYVLLLEMPNLRKTTKRTYLKIQELLARVGGIANAFYMAMNVLTSHFLRFHYLVFINKIGEINKTSPNIHHKLDEIAHSDQNLLKETKFNNKAQINIEKLNINKEGTLKSSSPFTSNQGNPINHFFKIENMNKIENEDYINTEKKLISEGGRDENRLEKSRFKINEECLKRKDLDYESLRLKLKDALSYKEKIFDEDNPLSYLDYLIGELACCCESKSQVKYKNFFQKAISLLDFTVLGDFLSNSYVQIMKEDKENK